MGSRLDGLYTPFAGRLILLIDRAAEAGLGTVDCFMGLRTIAQQDYLYELGRTVRNPTGASDEQPMGNIVTKARGGHSWHNYGLAADIVPRPDGKWTWAVEDDYWPKLGKIGKDLGLVWGGDFPQGQRDLDHFEMKGDLTTDLALELYAKGGYQAVWDKVTESMGGSLV